MNPEFDDKIQTKKDAVRSDAFVAKQAFDRQKNHLSGFGDDYIDSDPDIRALRHEIKLMMALFKQSNFDDIVHIIANPSRLMGINFIIGFIRGLGFSLAVIAVALAVALSV